MDALIAQGLHHSQSMGGIFHQGALGDLDFQPGGGQAGGCVSRQDVLLQIRIAELDRRDIDRDLDRGQSHGLPTHGVGARGLEHPGANRQDQADLFRERNEVERRYQSLFRMLPTDQCLDTDDDAAAGVDLRLIDQTEFLVLERPMEFRFQFQAGDGAFGERRSVVLTIVATLGFGSVHGGFGMHQQGFGILAIVRKQGDADAGRHDNAPVFEDERATDQFADAMRDQQRILDAHHVWQHDRKLVAAQAGHQAFRRFNAGVAGQATDNVAGAQPVTQAIGDSLQHLVADAVAEGIVDTLEAIEIEQQQGQTVTVDIAAHARQFAFQQFMDRLAIG